MNIIVCYDVNTQDKSGQKRLRKVAQMCQNYGQRVQYSVFECRVNESQYEAFRHQLTKIIRMETDSLRLYRLYGERERAVEVIGRDHYVDFDEPLIV